MIPPAAAHHCPRPLATGYGPGPEPEPEPRVPEPRASPGARGSFFFWSSIAALFPLRFPSSQSGRGAGGGGPPLAARPIRNATRAIRLLPKTGGLRFRQTTKALPPPPLSSTPRLFCSTVFSPQALSHRHRHNEVVRSPLFYVVCCLLFEDAVWAAAAGSFKSYMSR
jgi:hypothetical protein